MLAKHVRWQIIFVAFIGIVICYMDRAALAYAITPIKHYFGLNNEEFGFLSSAFAIGYLLMVFVGGVLVDKFGARSIWGIAALVWSLATLMIGFANSFTILLSLRLLLGIAEGPSFPGLTRAVTDWLPMKERGRALALGLAAVPLASVIGAPLSTSVIYYFGWQEMFIFLGVIGVFWSLLWMYLFRNKPSQSKLVSQDELAYINCLQQDESPIIHQNKTKWKFLLVNKTFWLNNYAFFAFGYLLFFGITWLPGYLSQIFHLNIKEVGVFLILPWLLATLSILFGGWLSDKLWNKTNSLRKARSLIIGIGLILSALLFIPAIMVHNLMIDMIFISLAVACGLLPNSCFYSLNADLAPDKVATSLGIMDAFLAAAGIIAPIATGYFSNLTGNFRIAIAIMVILNISAGLLVLLFQNPDKELDQNIK